MPDGADSDDAGTYDPRQFPPFAVTTDLAILSIRDSSLHVLLVRRAAEPFAGELALPGGFVGQDVDLLESAQGTLTIKTGVDIEAAHLEQLGTFGHPDRDPRMRIVSVAYLALLPNLLTTSTGAENHEWVEVDAATGLAFDHDTILTSALERARAKLEYTTLATTFCSTHFTISDLRVVYEAVWGHGLDPANFHRKALASKDFITSTGETAGGGPGRPAALFRAGRATTLNPPLSRPT